MSYRDQGFGADEPLIQADEESGISKQFNQKLKSLKNIRCAGWFTTVLLIYIALLLTGMFFAIAVGAYYASKSDFVGNTQNLITSILSGANRTINQDIPQQLNDLDVIKYKVNNISNVVSVFVNTKIPVLENQAEIMMESVTTTSNNINNELQTYDAMVSSITTTSNNINNNIPMINDMISSITTTSNGIDKQIPIITDIINQINTNIPMINNMISSITTTSNGINSQVPIVTDIINQINANIPKIFDLVNIVTNEIVYVNKTIIPPLTSTIINIDRNAKVLNITQSQLEFKQLVTDINTIISKLVN